MAYSLNPYLPRVRMRAVALVRNGWSMRHVARYTGVNVSTISRWHKIAPLDNRLVIPTKSSKPHHSPFSISTEIENAIIEERNKHKRCGQIIWHELNRRGASVSLSTVNRILKRKGLLKTRSPWKKYHPNTEHPLVLNPGDLVQVDTIHLGQYPERLFVYTLIDIFSRWAWALVSYRINTHKSVLFVGNAQINALFRFKTIQSDHGQEFSTCFTEKIKTRGLNHRHIRVRKPNDNGHLERFNRTIQEECLQKIPYTFQSYKKSIPEYLNYYNRERLHLGIDCSTPLEKINQVLRRS